MTTHVSIFNHGPDDIQIIRKQGDTPSFGDGVAETVKPGNHSQHHYVWFNGDLLIREVIYATTNESAA